MLPFTYTFERSVDEVLHDEAQVHRNGPGRPLPAEITHLTGLTDDDVRGERIDVEVAGALIDRSDLVVAQNARFGRPLVERVLGEDIAHRVAGRRDAEFEVGPQLLASDPSREGSRQPTTGLNRIKEGLMRGLL